MRFKESLAIILLLCSVMTARAVTFRSIERNVPVKARYEAFEQSVVDVMLQLDARTEARKDYYLRFVYVIGTDTITDHQLIDGNHKGIVKRLRLDATETVDVLMYLHDRNLELLTDITGELTIIRDPSVRYTDENSLPSFTGTVWDRQQIPLFRIVKQDSLRQVLAIKFDLTENFEYDKLYFNIKLINPSLGIQVLSKSIEVNPANARDLKQQLISIDIPEMTLNEKGTYYMQIIQRMGNKRVNGVKKVYYSLN